MSAEEKPQLQVNWPRPEVAPELEELAYQYIDRFNGLSSVDAEAAFDSGILRGRREFLGRAAKKWMAEENAKPAQVANRLRIDPSTLSNLLAGRYGFSVGRDFRSRRLLKVADFNDNPLLFSEGLRGVHGYVGQAVEGTSEPPTLEELLCIQHIHSSMSWFDAQYPRSRERLEQICNRVHKSVSSSLAEAAFLQACSFRTVKSLEDLLSKWHINFLISWTLIKPALTGDSTGEV